VVGLRSDSAVAMGQQAMLPDSKFMPLMGGDLGGGMDKKKKRAGKKDSLAGENGKGVQAADGNEEQRVFVGNLSWTTNFQAHFPPSSCC